MLKNIFLSIFIFSIALFSFNDGDYITNRVIIQLDRNINDKIIGVKTEDINTGIDKLDLIFDEIVLDKIKPLYFYSPQNRIADDLGMNEQYIIDYSANSSIESVIEKLSSIEEIIYVEPDFVYKPLANYTPTDSLISSQWGLETIEAYKGWGEKQKGAAGVVIGIIDDGINISHRDLRRSLYVNEAELNGTTGVDDDFNGLVDDINGYDFSDNDATLDHPTTGTNLAHGSYCAGIAAATDHTDLAENTGVVGVGFGAEILTAKIFPTASSSIIVNAIRYIADNADVSSNSYGSTYFSYTVQAAVNYSVLNGTIFIAASGNSNMSADYYPQFPARYDNAVSVAYTDNQNRKGFYSNYGGSVDIAAPGNSIISTSDLGLTGNDYQTASGTSAATPFVAGAAALCIAYEKDRGNTFTTSFFAGVNALRRVLEENGTEPNVTETKPIGKIVNIYNSLIAIDDNSSLPICGINNPEEGENFYEDDYILISANAYDSNGSISKVEFYVNDELKHTATAPNSYYWGWADANKEVGSHIIKAIAYDNDNIAVEDEIVIHIRYSGDNLSSQWENTYEYNDAHPDTYYEEIYDMVMDSNNDFISVGNYRNPTATISHTFVLKTDLSGSVIWKKIFSGQNAGTHTSSASSISLTDDGGYIIGTTDTDYFVSSTNYSLGVGLIKIDTNGDLVWKQIYGESNIFEKYPSAIQTLDGGYIFVAKRQGASAVYTGNIVKTSSNGTVVWEQILTDTGGDIIPKSVVQDNSGNFYISGFSLTTTNGANGFAAFLIKLDNSGTELFRKKFNYGSFESMILDNTGNLVMTGKSMRYETAGDFWIVKTDTDGNILADKSFGSLEEDAALHISQTNDDGYILTGVTTNNYWYDFYIIKTANNGSFEWSSLYGNNYSDMAYSTMQTPDGSFMISGYGDWAGYGKRDAVLVKTGVPSSSSNYELPVKNYELKQNYPNPFNPTTKINYTSAPLSVSQSAEIVVYNSLGQQVWSSPITHHALRVTDFILFDGSKFNSGIYYYSLIVDGKRLSTKSMVLIK